jgi:hypothetical protein
VSLMMHIAAILVAALAAYGTYHGEFEADPRGIPPPTPWKLPPLKVPCSTCPIKPTGSVG